MSDRVLLTQPARAHILCVLRLFITIRLATLELALADVPASVRAIAAGRFVAPSTNTERPALELSTPSHSLRNCVHIDVNMIEAPHSGHPLAMRCVYV